MGQSAFVQVPNRGVRALGTTLSNSNSSISSTSDQVQTGGMLTAEIGVDFSGERKTHEHDHDI